MTIRRQLSRLFLPLVCPLAVIAADAPPAPRPPPGAAGWSFTELRRIPAPEARQGVATDGTFLYAITNRGIGKYRADTGERAAAWEGPADGPIIHLNAGIVYQGRLYCAHSNYPGVPMFSSVEIWDTKDLRHVGSHSFGRTDGSLTWLDRRNGHWIACFVHYAKKGGEPGRGPEWTRLVEYDDDWRETGGWGFPPNLMAALGERGYSISGGAMGPGGHLFATGHDNTELYVLDFPTEGAQMAWSATFPVPAEGQAFSWNPVRLGEICMILKPTREIIIGRVTAPPPQ